MSNSNQKGKIGLFALVTLSSAFVVSIRNVPTIAETGMQMLFFAGLAAICFFIPAALISAELATGWPRNGGIYAWVAEAFGKKWGFFASWLQWTNMLLSVISMLYFVGGSLAFAIYPPLFESRLFVIAVLLLVVWACTLFGLKGLKSSSKISSIGFLGGVLFPAILIVLFGLAYLIMGKPIQLDMTFSKSNYFPKFSDFGTLVLILAFMRTFTGVEASANHANKVVDPQRNYPIAIFFVVVAGIAVNVLGALSVAVVVPQEKISLIAGIMEAFEVFFQQFHLTWLVPILAILVAGGAIGGINAWLMGPIKGLLATAEGGNLPPFMREKNKNDVPRNLLLIQAIVLSVVGSLFLLFPQINTAFWIAVAFSMMIYVTMYFLMMLAALYLRYKKPDVKRAYRIPGKRNIGMWIVSVIGMVTMVFSFVLALFPPKKLKIISQSAFVSVLVIGVAVVFAIPYIISKFKKPSWSEKVEGEK
ncbi:MAG TPA: APC family permease [Chlamydiales bacterium]|nr:APC family permease [Chlamydiales bacterium]